VTGSKGNDPSTQTATAATDSFRDEPSPFASHREGEVDEVALSSNAASAPSTLPSPGVDALGEKESMLWERHVDERWVVGDPGRQAEVVPLAAKPWSRPDTVLDGATVDQITFRAASIRGIGHQQYARPRQDAYGYLISDVRPLLVGCVADGVSEGRWSHHAADIACAELTRRVLEAIEQAEWTTGIESLPWSDLVDATNNAIVSTAVTRLQELGRLEHRETTEKDLPITMSDAARLLSTTAIVFAVSAARTPEGAHPFLIGLVAGDSSAYMLSDGVWNPLTGTKGEEGGVITSSVSPLPGPQEVEVFSGQLEPGDCLVIVTDGVGDPLGSGSGAVGSFLANAWKEPPSILAFGDQVGFLRKNFTDDRTAFAIWPRHP
jgi:serine/threonine protein phosphatase PrpC